MSNFPNGSLVMRVWKVDGSSELVAKFQYFGHAELFGEMMAERDYERNASDCLAYFYLAVCDYENRARAFLSKAKEAKTP